MNTLIPNENASQNLVYLTISIAVLTIVGVLAIYHETVWSMVATWYRSETYAHGFLILPFVIYMIWAKRCNVITISPQPCPFALIALCILGFFWLIAELASVQILAQYIVVAMLPVVVAAVLGSKMMYALFFPLAYLFFAVPFGDILIQPLINFTADFTVNALQFSGIPVYREGTFFSLPSGNWSVIEACSGLRYLIASVTLGTLYAYLTYQSLSRRFIFIAFSIIVPIIANGIRAYLIVMIGHLSDMQLAVGVDHLVYGWVFFGVVMLILFWIGSIWREDGHDEAGIYKTKEQLTRTEAHAIPVKKTILVACSALVVALIWPVYATYLEKEISDDTRPYFSFNFPDSNWRIVQKPITDWSPIYVGTPEKYLAHFINKENQRISLFITYYHHQQHGNELINFGNILVPEFDSAWRKINEHKQIIKVDKREFELYQSQLSTYSENLLVWRWYILGDAETVNPYMAKVLLAKNRLFSGNDSGAEVILAVPYDIRPDEAVPVLQQFLVDMSPAIADNLENLNQP